MYFQQTNWFPIQVRPEESQEGEETSEQDGLQTVAETPERGE